MNKLKKDLIKKVFFNTKSDTEAGLRMLSISMGIDVLKINDEKNNVFWWRDLVKNHGFLNLLHNYHHK